MSDSYLCLPSTIDRVIVVEGKALFFKISGSFEKEMDLLAVVSRLGARVETDIVSMLVTDGVDDIDMLSYINGRYVFDTVSKGNLSEVYTSLADKSLFIGKRTVSVEGVKADQYLFSIKKGVLV